jgi:hypothetical protein
MIARLSAVIVLLVLAPTDARAQVAATSFDQLQPRLKPGDVVLITETGGRRVEGRVLELSSSALDVQVLKPRPDGLDVRAAQRRLAEADVRQIAIEHPDRLWNGTLVGLGVAALPGIVTMAYGLSAADAGYTRGAEVAFAGLVVLGIGAGTGAMVDASLVRRTTVYAREPLARSDTLWNGMFIGFAAGAAPAALVGTAAGAQPGEIAAVASGYGVIGLLTGLLVDVFHKDSAAAVSVHQSARRSRIALHPFRSRSATGLRLVATY